MQGTTVAMSLICTGHPLIPSRFTRTWKRLLVFRALIVLRWKDTKHWWFLVRKWHAVRHKSQVFQRWASQSTNTLSPRNKTQGSAAPSVERATPPQGKIYQSTTTTTLKSQTNLLPYNNLLPSWLRWQKTPQHANVKNTGEKWKECSSNIPWVVSGSEEYTTSHFTTLPSGNRGMGRPWIKHTSLPSGW